MYQKWQAITSEAITRGNLFEFRKNIREIISDFQSIKIKKTKKPKVGIVGEILIKYHAFGNDHLVEKLEAEGAEVCVPELMGFVKYCAYNGMIKEKLLKTSKKTAFFNHQFLNLIDFYERYVKQQLRDTHYRDVTNIYELAKNVDGIISTGN